MLRAVLALILFAAAGGAAWLLAPRLAALAEARYAAQVEATLTAGGFGWASGAVDGLKVTLSGAAPTAAQAAEAAEIVAAISPVLTIANAMTAAPKIEPALIPPELEVLKGADGLILIGIIADEAMAEALGGDRTLLRYGAAPFGADWAATSELLSAIANGLRHARISIRDGDVTINGLAETEAARAAVAPLIERLGALGWRTGAAIDAPPPALTDFRLKVAITPGAVEIACAASSAADAAAIEAAAKKRLNAVTRCAIGAGAPDDAWADAALAVLATLAQLDAAEAELSGKIVALTPRPPSTAKDAARAREALTAGLPPGYLLILDDGALAAETAAPPAFALSIDWPGGDAALKISSAQAGDGLTRAQAVLGAYARALFPNAKAEFTAKDGAPPPEGWRRAVRISLEALSKLQRGAVQINDGAISLTGAAERRGDIRIAHDALAAAGPDWRVTSRIAFDPAPIAAAQPLPPGRCAALVNEAAAGAPVSFQPASATLTPASAATVERIAAILPRCADARFEIGGHTDAQGSEGGNLALSRARAEAVLTALIAAKAPPGRLIARGYGEARPIDDNDTAAGRARNRRIEFTLIEEAE